MKRCIRRIFVALLAVAVLAFGSGLSAHAFAGFAGFADKLKDIINISVDTMLYSNNDFDRTITFTAMLDAVDADEYFGGLNNQLDESGLSDEIFLYSRGGQGDDERSNSYVFTLSHGTLKDFETFTSILLPSSSISMVANEDEIGPFCDSYQIKESINYAEACSLMQAKCTSFICSYKGFETVVQDGGGVVDGNTLTYTCTKNSDSPVSPEFEFSKVITYNVDGLSVATDISSTNVISVAVALDFSDVSGDGTEAGYSVGASAANHFIKYVESHPDSRYNHPKLRLEPHESITTANVAGEVTDDSSVDTDYRLVLRTEGNYESVSEVLASVFGEGNSFTVSKGKVNSSNFLFDRNSIVHSVDLSALCADAGFNPAEVSYSFSGSIGSGLLDMSIKGQQGSQQVEVKDNQASGSADSAMFKVVVDYETLDIGALIVAILIGALLLCLAAFILKLLRRRSGKKRKIKSDDIRYEAVKSVALALVPEQERTNVIEVPSELMNRPTVVIKPKSDDGLDDDDDDPEGVILFSMMLRILFCVQLVLFFFPYFNVTKSNLLDTVTTITGLDLFLGFKIGDVMIEPNRFAIILFVLPLIMLICLMARRILPKLALPVAISAGSVFSIFYLINLNNTIYDHLSDAIDAAASAGSFVSQPASQTGFDYSIVIYIVLAIGGIILLFSNIMAMMAVRRQKRDEEMRRFEK